MEDIYEHYCNDKHYVENAGPHYCTLVRASQHREHVCSCGLKWSGETEAAP